MQERKGGSHDDRGEVGGMTGVGGAGGVMGGMGGLRAGREVSQEVLSQQLLSLLQVLRGVLVIFGVVLRIIVAGDGRVGGAPRRGGLGRSAAAFVLSPPPPTAFLCGIPRIPCGPSTVRILFAPTTLLGNST